MVSKNRKIAFKGGFNGIVRRGFNPLSIPGLLQWLEPINADNIFPDKANTGDFRTLQVGRCYDFDGSNDYVLLPSLTRINLSGNTIRIKGWFNKDANNGGLFSQGGFNSGGYSFYITSGGKIGMFNKQAGSATNYRTFEGDTTLSNGVWYYFDVEFTEDTFTASIGPNPDNLTAETITTSSASGTYGDSDEIPVMGARDEGNSLNFNGQLFGLEVYQDGTQVFYAKCDEGAGTVSFDSSGNSNNGTITNATLTTFHSTQDVVSYQNDLGYSRRMYFNGSATYVTVPFDAGSITNGTVEFDIVTTDDAGVALTAGTQAVQFFFAWDEGSSSTLNAGCGVSVTYEVDGVSFSGSRDALHSLIADGELHHVKVEGLDLSSWSESPRIGWYNPSAGFRVSGVISDFKVDANSNGTFDNHWQGYGNTDAYWTDIIGSDDGTVVGSPNNIYIPAVNATTDVLGNTLQYSGKAPNYAIPINSNCVDFDGNNDIITAITADVSNNNWEFEVTIFADTASGLNEIIRQNGAGTPRAWLRIDNGDLVTFIGSGRQIIKSGITTNTEYDLKLVYDHDTTTLTAFVDGVEEYSASKTMETASGIITLGGNDTASAVPYKGKMWNAKFTDSTTPANSFHYKMAEGAGVTVFDATGNGNHGTIENAILSTFWSTQDEYHANLKDGFSKRMYSDGVDDYVDLADSFLDLSGNELRIKASITVGADPRVIFSQGGATGGWVLNTDSANKLRIVLKQSASASNYRTILSSVILNQNQVYDIDITFTKDSATVLIDGVEDGSVNLGSIAGVYGDSASNVVIGARGDASLFWQGLVFDVEFYKNDALLSSFNGYGNTNADWVDQIGSNNGTVNGSPENIYIPAVNATTDALGSTLTNPPATTYIHNGAETEIDFTGGVAHPDAVIGSWETAWVFNTARTNPLFKRTIEQGGADVAADRFLAYEATLSGDDLTKVTNYTTTLEI